MTRTIICTVRNFTDQSFYADPSQTNVWNGKELLNPQVIVPGGGAAQELFSYEKTTGATTGVTGKVIYQLGNSTSLQLSFNNPYVQAVTTPEYAYSLCFFYAGIIHVSGENIPRYKVLCAVETDGQPWDPADPSPVGQLSATISIYNNH